MELNIVEDTADSRVVVHTLLAGNSSVGLVDNSTLVVVAVGKRQRDMLLSVVGKDSGSLHKLVVGNYKKRNKKLLNTT